MHGLYSVAFYYILKTPLFSQYQMEDKIMERIIPILINKNEKEAILTSKILPKASGKRQVLGPPESLVKKVAGPNTSDPTTIRNPNLATDPAISRAINIVK
jgi:hypothetical protein